MTISSSNIFLKNRKGFTLIEIIMTIVLIGVIMVPVGLMCGEYMRKMVYSGDLAVAESLA